MDAKVEELSRRAQKKGYLGVIWMATDRLYAVGTDK